MAALLTSLFGIVPRMCAWIYRTISVPASNQPEGQDNDDKQRHLDPMEGLWPDKLSTDMFNAHLERYPGYIRDVYQHAEKERFENIPAKLKNRHKPFITREELKYMDKWIQKRGTPLDRNVHVANAKLINRNKNNTVQEVTGDAFVDYKENKDIDRAFGILRKLRGVGPARASLLLSLAYPDTVPFFSRPLYRWICRSSEDIWGPEFQWTTEKYTKILQEIKVLKDKHSTRDHQVSAVDVEKVVFVLEYERIFRDLKVEKIKEPPDKDNSICGKGTAFVYKVKREGLDGGDGSVALKAIYKGPEFPNKRRTVLAEISSSSLLAKKSRDHFVEFIGWNEERHHLFIAMEYIELGDLEHNLKDRLWKEMDIRETTKQLLNGLKIMHDNGIIHRDLKPQNILVVCNSPGNVKVKITDFGTSKRLSNRETTYAVTTKIGTGGYKAPEVVKRRADEVDNSKEPNIDERWFYTYKVDIWSLGCIIYKMAMGDRLFTSDDEVNIRYPQVKQRLGKRVKKIKKTLMKDSKCIGEEGAEFVQKLMAINEENRPDVNQALKDFDRWEIIEEL
ncbi:kinase-like protein [Hypoxylon cercidicola]|nr:kinase-like protein [Hypoxylon cercidicola]